MIKHFRFAQCQTMRDREALLQQHLLLNMNNVYVLMAVIEATD